MSASQHDPTDMAHCTSELESIFNFLVELKRPSSPEDERHQYDMHVALSFGTSEPFIHHNIACEIGLNKIKLYAQGDLINDRVIDLCEKLNRPYLIEEKTYIRDSNLSQKTEKIGSRAKSNSIIELSASANKEVTSGSEQERSTETAVKKGPFEVHVAPGKIQVWTVKKPLNKPRTLA